ncbi:hypothetical protein E5Q_06223 [Mixia osmundae IAM 14324]|uniref:Major facilitator superfamily (MFS) profile domain-containing protein n=2 Tax=Mixia osmundae (strain CBS 9802 / IAM 14324 / JCM 22182 / KY 12970) TaxID=764103 RepID=G7E8Q4_MIXOS|nr:hypothetical protein E5Q_06223 [Mixia osmundae IAM 14324]
MLERRRSRSSMRSSSPPSVNRLSSDGLASVQEQEEPEPRASLDTLHITLPHHIIRSRSPDLKGSEYAHSHRRPPTIKTIRTEERRDGTVHEEIISVMPSDAIAVGQITPHVEGVNTKKDARFWAIIMSIMVSVFVSAIDLTAISTALPTIVRDLQSDNYTWVGSAYALSSTAFIPWMGGLAQIFGRRAAYLTAIFLFAAGSALCGASQNMTMLIAARTLQGAGGGGILAISEILIVDLSPLSERGIFFAIFGAEWALASVISPVIAGSLAERNWRWIFYMNIPICGFAALLVICFMNLRRPAGTFREKLSRVDWFGNLCIIASTSSFVVGLTFGGGQYPWRSYQTLLPLVLGLVGIVISIGIERAFIKEPVVPFKILSNLTSAIGFLATFLHAIITLALVYYLPVYFQSAKGSSPIRSGIQIFPLSFTVAPFAIITGLLVMIQGKYRWLNVIGWALAATGAGVLYLLSYDARPALWIGLPLVVGAGLGMLYSAVTFPVMSPLPPSLHGHAMCFSTYIRNIGQTIGIVIGGTVLSSRLPVTLPEAFLDQLVQNGGGAAGDLAYASIPIIPTLVEPLKSQVQDAFAKSIRVIWLSCVPMALIGVLVSFFIVDYTLSHETDENWGRASPTSTASENSMEKQSTH